MSHKLTDDQQLAIDKITDLLLSPVGRSAVLTGYAGTGKTYALSEIIKRFPYATVCAPTNKAGIVLRDAVAANTGKMINVKTVSALTQRFSHEVVSDEEEARRKAEKARRETHDHALPVGNSTSELVFEEKRGDGEHLIICDEASMLNTETADRLAEAADFTLFVGDPFQLPPVEGDQFLREDPDQSIVVMKELVRSPDIHINTFGLEIRQGRPFGNFVDRFSPQVSFAELVKQGYRFISFTNRHRELINHMARKALGYTSPRIGEPIVFVKTFDYGGRNHITNNTTATILRINDHTGVAQVKLDLLRAGNVIDVPLRSADWQYAYCLTAHKAQGSTFEKVGVVNSFGSVHSIATKTGAVDPNREARRWLYTAITRAKKELVLLPGQPEGFINAS